MITLESTVDEVDVTTLKTKLDARNSLQVRSYTIKVDIKIY